MDADHPSTDRTAPAPGGTVEPANRAGVAKERFQTPVEVPGERYELRDPFADVTYRANTLADMVAKAEQLGSSRFVALDQEGRRTPVQKVDGTWQRGPQRAAAPERPLDLVPVRDDMPEATRAAKAPTTSRSQAPAEAAPDKTDAKAIARIDTQAERAAQVARIEAALRDRYLIKRAPVTLSDVTIGRTEYRFRGDTSRVAFTESTFRLATDTNSPSVARSMVDVAEARNWRGVRVSGNEDFRRMVWLEASVRGVRALGYEPNPADLELLKREREARLVNRIEPARGDGPSAAEGPVEKASGRGSGGRKAVLAAIEAVLIAKRVPEPRREAILAAATEKFAQRIRDGKAPSVKVWDVAAPTQRTVERPAGVPTPEVQRTRDRAAPVR
ncbi:LPD7 domain-containing protein [Ideonella sp. A 288]|uniref:LPD7 domain-containing protein n=1 Tax=Ideonella sp. A 288 TaxID=1962181 RepID=UPI000B4B2584|nr:LPD7 domain-containing protein [Ideonella sp. A 288]